MRNNRQTTEWETRERLQNGKQERDYKMGNKRETTEWETRERLQNGKQERDYRMGNNRQTTEWETTEKQYLILLLFLSDKLLL